MSRRFTVEFSEGVKKDLARLRAYDCRILLEAIPPIWQLRVGAFRVFYDVNEEERRVYVRAIRRKPAHLKTEEIL